jgi:hypothetical protein
MELYASTTRHKGDTAEAEARNQILARFTADPDAVIVIKPKAKTGSSTLCLSLGKFLHEEDGLIEWIQHPKTAHLGNDGVTVSNFSDLAYDGPTIPVLLGELAPELSSFATENAGVLHDWLELKEDHALHGRFLDEYRRGGSLLVMQELLKVQEDGGVEEAAAAEEFEDGKATDVMEAEVADEAAPWEEDPEPRRGRLKTRAKRQPSASPAASKPTPKKASPSKLEATPARRSARISDKATATPSTAMAKLKF